MDELQCLPDDANAACHRERHVCTTDVLLASKVQQVHLSDKEKCC